MAFIHQIDIGSTGRNVRLYLCLLHWLHCHLSRFERIIPISAIDIDWLHCVKAVKSTNFFFFIRNVDECPKCISIYSVISRFAFHTVNDPMGSLSYSHFGQISSTFQLQIKINIQGNEIYRHRNPNNRV